MAKIDFTGKTIPTFTEGSIPFASATGALTEDNANLFWDDTNNYLGLGTNTPSVELDIQAPNPLIWITHTGSGTKAIFDMGVAGLTMTSTGDISFGDDNNGQVFFHDRSAGACFVGDPFGDSNEVYVGVYQSSAYIAHNGNTRFGGNTAPTATVHIDGDLVVKRTATAVSANTAGEIIIGVTSTAAARTVTLDSSDVVNGQIIIIKDESGGAGTNNITVATEGLETIDGASTMDITADYGCLRVYSDGTNWFSW